MIRKLILSFFLFLSLTPAFARRTVEFYVVAHQDDWQLFMGLNAYNAMNDDTSHKVVFIHTTAGDATYGNKVVNKKNYIGREIGAINSIEFCLDIKSMPVRNYIDTVTINGHKIRRFSYKNVVDYFLRLPDGCGSAGWNGQSIQYIHDKLISNIMAVDSSAVYTSWGDLVGTVRTIMEQEMDTCTDVGLNIAETDERINPNDHLDHLHTSYLAQDATRDMGHIWTRQYIEYHLHKLPVNLSPEEVALKAAIYGVTEFGRTQNSGYSSWSKDHLAYVCRDYWRKIPSRVDTLLNGGAGRQAVIYPNPVNDFINVAYKLEQQGQVTIYVQDMSGQMALAPLSLSKNAGDHLTRVSCSTLMPGTYVLLLALPNASRSFTFTKL